MVRSKAADHGVGGEGGGPMGRYRALLAARELAYDPAQERAMEKFQALHLALQSYRPGRSSFSLLSFFSSGRQKTLEPRGLYVCGGVGRGKSMLMDLFFEATPVEPKRRVHFHAFMQEIHGAIRAWRNLSASEKRRRLRSLGLSAQKGDDPLPPVAKAVADSATLLCFDELQVTDVADALILGRLFQSLFDFGVVVVCTSNRQPRDLYRGGINRQLFLPFIDLIMKRMDTHHLDAKTDYRLERLQGLPVYYTPVDDTARSRMDAAWSAVTDTDQGTPCEITVQGRTLPVPQAAKGAARFSFDDLCAKPLGAADYLALAERFHTILIDAIPAMGPEKRNEAKRFVTLIDALYENGVNLVASADAGPTDLYPDGDGAFEFERTASRLIEMQSADYIARRRAPVS